MNKKLMGLLVLGLSFAGSNAFAYTVTNCSNATATLVKREVNGLRWTYRGSHVPYGHAAAIGPRFVVEQSVKYTPRGTPITEITWAEKVRFKRADGQPIYIGAGGRALFHLDDTILCETKYIPGRD